MIQWRQTYHDWHANCHVYKIAHGKIRRHNGQKYARDIGAKNGKKSKNEKHHHLIG